MKGKTFVFEYINDKRNIRYSGTLKFVSSNLLGFVSIRELIILFGSYSFTFLLKQHKKRL